MRSMTALLVFVVVSCASDDTAPAFRLDWDDSLLRPTPVLFDSLLHPVDIAVGSGGDIYVADDGDKSVKVFSSSGKLKHIFGREGRGPGELQSVRGLALVGDVVVVLDGDGRRLERWTVEGELLPPIPYQGMEEVFASAGVNLVTANNPSWSVEGGPIARVVRTNGAWRDIGKRPGGMTPFASHIANFVLPMGTRDGNAIWLAYLNEPIVERISIEGLPQLRIDRPLPFSWRQIHPDFDPREVKPANLDAVPFDQISKDIDVDAHGRAYVLTSAGEDVSGSPPETLLDIIDPNDRSILRVTIRMDASNLAVTSTGNVIYVVDASTATVTAFARTAR